MKLNQLESLMWVARLRSFQGAAARLNATQPAISIRIRELERELGTTLIDRGRRGVCLTAEGRECLAYAEQVTTSVSELRRRMGTRDAVRGRVSLGVSELIVHTWLPSLLGKIGARYPDVQVDATVDMTPRLLRGLDSGEFDVILVGTHNLATTYPTFELGRVPYFWMTRDEIRGRRKRLSPRELERHCIITWSPEAAVHQPINDWFTANGAHLTRRIVCNTAASMAAMAEAGLGVTLLPLALVERELSEGRLRIIPTEPEFAPVPYWAVYVPSQKDSPGRIVAEMSREVSSFLLTKPKKAARGNVTRGTRRGRDRPVSPR
jgi:DNA-binding transcriptional LysR family regulator